MFSGALLLLTDSLCVYLRPFFGGPFRETSFTTGKRRAHPGTFDREQNRKKPASLSFSCLNKKKEDVSSGISPTQQNSLESARFPRTSKITSNQQDSFESDRLSLGLAAPESGRHSPTTSHHRDTSPHSCPQPETQPCRVICHRGTHRTFSGSWGICCGPEATAY